MPARARPTTLLAFVMLIALGLAASTWQVFGQTWDEPEHLAAGLSLLDQGQYDYDIQHPPIARALIALGPYLAGARSQGTRPPDGKPEGNAILYGGGHQRLYLTLARAGTLPFLALLVFVTFLWAGTVLGPWAAVIAAAFTATTPVVLGHGALATLDVPAAATTLFALYATRRWFETGRLREALVLGIALGVALGTKLSAIPFCGLGAIVLGLLRLWERRGRADPATPVSLATWFGGGVLAAVAVGLVLTLAYGGQFIYLTDETHRFNQALWFLFGSSGPLHDWAYALAAHVKVPKAVQWYLGGIEAVVVHNRNGHLSYLLGEARVGGWWYFYLVALGAKTPLSLLALGLPGIWLLVRDGFRLRDARRLALPALAVALLAFSSVFSRINIGVRHVLFVYPILAVGAAYTLARAKAALEVSSPGLRRSLAVAALGGLALAQAVTVIRAWPDYLAYFNVLVAEPEHVLVDSDLDWGQDLHRLVRRLRELGVPSVAIAYSGSADLAREGLPPYVVLRPDQRASGWIAVSALARAEAPEHFDWLAPYPRRERIGKTIDLYLVPPGAD